MKFVIVRYNKIKFCVDYYVRENEFSPCCTNGFVFENLNHALLVSIAYSVDDFICVPVRIS